MVDFDKLRGRTKTAESVAPEPTAQGGTVATRGETSLARPDFIPRSTQGAEGITRDDVLMPRLAIAQKTSKQIDENEPSFNPNLKLGDMYNSVTGKIYGRGPVQFYVVRRDRPRFIEFNPLDQGGGVKDMNVPFTDPRTQFRRGENGETLPPLATMFYDFYVLTLPLDADNPAGSIICLSMKSTAIKVAKQLNRFIKESGAAVWARKYAVTTVPEKNKKGSYFNYSVDYLGWVDTAETYAALEVVHKSVSDQDLAARVDRDASREDYLDPDAEGAEKEL